MIPCPCLQLDVGNSSAKWRLVEAGEIVARGVYSADDAGSEEALLACTGFPAAVWVSSVAGESRDIALRDLLVARWGVEPWFARSELETAGLRNSYNEPGRMGVDRWLAMLAARHRHPGRGLCVVDAGSALTIDLVAADGRHDGGYIIPGPALMERALLLDTGRVRFSEPADYALRPGTSTAEAVRHGIALSQLGAVTLALRPERGAAEPLAVFTGGGGEWLWHELGGSGELVPDLVLEGLELAAREHRQAATGG